MDRQLIEFISKLYDDQKINPINFDRKELIFQENDIDIDYYDEKGINVITNSINLKKIPLNEDRYIFIFKSSKALSFLKKIQTHFINNVYVLNDGTIIVEITNKNQERILITDVGLDNQFSINNDIEELLTWFTNPQINEEEPKETDTKTIMEYEQERITQDKLNEEIKKEEIKIESSIRKLEENKIETPRSFGNRVILIVDRNIKGETVLKNYPMFKNREDYKDAVCYNFFAMLDGDESFMLKCIALIEEMRVYPEKSEELYKKFQDVCNKWYLAVKNLGVTDIVCKRVFASDKLTVPEIVMWLWGYFVIGQKVNWILCEGNQIRMMVNEFQKNDLKSSENFKAEASRVIRNQTEHYYMVNSIDQYMSIGCANYLLDNGHETKLHNWKSDNVTFESHIAGAFGTFTRIPNREPIIEQTKMLVNSSRLELYKLFVKRFYGV